MSKNKDKKTIYYDGTCPMCTAFVSAVDNSNKTEGYKKIDSTRGVLPEGIERADVEKEIYLVGPDGTTYKNAEAVLMILASIPRLRFLSSLGKLPFVRPLLPYGYTFIAANRYFLFGPLGRLFWIKAIVALGLLSGLLISLHLWIPPRTFPHIPFIEIFPSLPGVLEIILYPALLVTLIGVVVRARPRRLIGSALVILTVYILFDQMRLQPWLYQYILMLGALGIFSWRKDDYTGGYAVMQTGRVIVAGIYFFSGLQKLNPTFPTNIFLWLIEPLAIHLSPPLYGTLIAFGALVPFIEIAIGIGILTQKKRNIAIIAAVAMHILILLLIGPFGHNWNEVVWPWNVVMITLVLLLFWNSKDAVSLRKLFTVKHGYYHSAVIILIWIAPFLNFFNSWDSYLSASLYSGNTAEAEIIITRSLQENLPSNLRQYVATTTLGYLKFDFSQWSFDELHVPPYPEFRVYEKIARHICNYAPMPTDAVITLFRQQTLFDKELEEYHSCATIK